MGWSRPWRTRISLHTFSSLPLTFFFAIAFKATSRVTSCDTESAEPARLGSTGGRLEAGEAAGDAEGEPDWQRSTCHVARWMTESGQGRLKVTWDKREGRADHDFSKRASPEHLLDLIILFLVRRRRLRQNLLRHQRKHFWRAVKDFGSALRKGAEVVLLSQPCS